MNKNLMIVALVMTFAQAGLAANPAGVKSSVAVVKAETRKAIEPKKHLKKWLIKVELQKKSVTL